MSISPHEKLAADQTTWRQTVQKGLHSFKEALAGAVRSKDTGGKTYTRRTDHEQTSPVHSVQETATPTSAIPVTPNLKHHSLLRLTDAYQYHHLYYTNSTMYSVFVCTCTHTFENDEFVHFSLKYAGMWWAFTPHILPDLIFV